MARCQSHTTKVDQIPYESKGVPLRKKQKKLKKDSGDLKGEGLTADILGGELLLDLATGCDQGKGGYKSSWTEQISKKGML